jgi:pimeloyl-ACP methyl ester carboxylesterase
MVSRTAFRSTAEVAGLAVTILEPAAPANGRVLYCLPGGGMSRRYFDLDAAGYSMAEHLAERGFTVVTIDHPGVGDSPPPDDAWTLTPHVVADADTDAVRQLHKQLGGIPIGVGHSMGGMLTVAIQARHRPYAALGLLGYAHSDHYELTSLAAYLSDEEKSVVGNPDAIASELVRLAKERFGRPLPKGDTRRSDFLLAGMEVPEEALVAMDGCAASLLAICGLGSMLKCTAPDVKLIDVPVFIGFGERDITGNARATADALVRCPDITLFELSGSGHNHNVAPNRTVLWDRLATWAAAVA